MHGGRQRFGAPAQGSDRGTPTSLRAVLPWRHKVRISVAWLSACARRATALVALGACGVAWAQASGRSGPPDIMPVSEVRDGMEGYGLTVFHGGKIDTFRVTVLAVLRGHGVQSDAIVARASGGPLEETGIAQGMSGSPIYIDGKLVGAAAWTWSFSKAPIVGITPIEYMLRIPDRPMESPGPKRFSSAGHTLPPDWWREPAEPPAWASRAPEVPQGLSGDAALAEAGGTQMVPIKTPLFVTGVKPQVHGLLQELLEPYHVNVVQGGTAAADSFTSGDLAPGSSLGVKLIDGDINLMGVGTTTWRDGDAIIGFGHPMFGSGHVDYPIALSYVHFLWPSQLVSFKLSSAGPVVGALRQDRTFGVAGVLGEPPAMLPVELNIRGGARPHSVNFRVVRDREIMPLLVGSGLFNSLVDLEALSGPQTVEMRTTIEIEGHEPVRRDNFYTEYGGMADAAFAAAAPLRSLSWNPFEPVKIRRITYDIEFRDDIEGAYLRGLEIPRRVVRPGDPLIVRSRLLSYLGREFEVTTQLTTAPDMPEGVYLLRVGDAASAEKWTVSRSPGRFVPEDLGHLIELLNYEERNDRLTFEVVNSDLGMTVDDQVLPSLPHTTFQMLRHAVPSGHVGPVLGDPVVREQVPVGLYVMGSQEITVAIYKHARPR